MSSPAFIRAKSEQRRPQIKRDAPLQSADKAARIKALRVAVGMAKLEARNIPVTLPRVRWLENPLP